MKNEYEDKYGMTKDIIKYADADILPPFRIDKAKKVEVLEIEVLAGEGTKECPMRLLRSYWTLNGIKIATIEDSILRGHKWVKD